MEYIRMRDSNTSPQPTEDQAAPFIQSNPSILAPNSEELNLEDLAWPSSSPSTANFQYADKSRPSSRHSLHPKPAEPKSEPPRSKPLFRGFERPSFPRIAILALLCLITYPAFYILTLVAKDRSLFVVRAIVSVWCSGIGFALGYMVLKVGAQYLEAATWATAIHMSHEGDGMKLRDLARGSSSPTSFMPALHIFRSRLRNQETSRRSRKSYDKRPWSLFLAFFVILAILAPLLPFLFGRIMRIETFVSNQDKVYREVLVAGDLSKDDVSQARIKFNEFQGFATAWTLLPYGGSASNTAEFAYGNDTVYFAQPNLSQLIPGGSGPGAFRQSASIGLYDTPNNTLPLTGRNAPKTNAGAILRYSQWGIRIHCEKLPDPEVNLTPVSRQNITYAFLPQTFLRGLFGGYGMDLPTQLAKPDFSGMDTNDTVPSNIDPSTISYPAKFSNKGAAIGFHSVLYNEQSPTDGWTAIETSLIRLNTSLAPSGRFPVYSNQSSPDANGTETRIGHDAAVCLYRYEAWVVETYNSSIVSPSTMRIVEKGNGSTSMSPSGNIRGTPMANTRYLNTTGKTISFFLAHNNGLNMIWKDNDRSANYVPSPTIISFTNGTGPLGYTELSPDRLAVVRARVCAANALPYLVGSAPIVAQAYADETLAYVTYKQWELISLPALVLILGIIGELFVPTLPLNIPRREFGVYSWLTLFLSQELRFEAADDLDKFMSLDELEERCSDKRVKFIV